MGAIETTHDAASKPTSGTAAGHPLIALDVMRALAAFLVVAVHARSAAFPAYGDLPDTQQSLINALFYGLTRGGKEAVLVFFVLSGYLVGGQIITRASQGRFRISDYMIDRATRILPPLMPACLVAACVGFLFYGVTPDFGQVAGNMLLLNGVVVETLEWNGSLWTIPFEIWFYVFGGAAAAIFAHRQKLLPLCAFCIAVAIFCVLDARYLLFWLLGALMIMFRGDERAKELAVVGAVIFVLGFALHQLSKASVSLDTLQFSLPALGEFLLCLGIALTLPFLTTPGVNVALGWLKRPFLFLSAMSYSLYLFHYPVIQAVQTFMPRAEAITAGTFAIFFLHIFLSLLLGFVAYSLVEKHTGKLRSFAKQRMGARRDAVAGSLNVSGVQ